MLYIIENFNKPTKNIAKTHKISKSVKKKPQPKP